jgi:multidrug efflux pump
VKLYELSVRRPVLATVMSLVIVIFGIISFTFLGVREFPSVDSPVITVSTSYAGANASVVESQITEPLEESVNGIEGIRSLVSTTREGRSTIQVEFGLGEDLDRAANDVRDRVSRVMSRLPPDVDPPQISKASDDESPIIFLAVYSDQRNLLELTRVAEEQFAERFQTVPGVSRVDIWGQRRYAMRLRLDPQRLGAYRLSLNEVRQALARENVELPSGRLEGDDVQLTIRTLSRLETPEEFENVILREEGGQTIRLRDVGRAELAAQNERTILKREGIPMVGVVVRPLPGANNVAIAAAVHERLGQIVAELPPDIQYNVGFDTSEFIRASISEVQRTVFLALFLVILIIFLFLRDWRTTLVPVVTIPVALIGAFFIMWVLGFSINVLTLLAMVLAIGIVVDDAIVVVENIYKKIEGGSEPIGGSVDGTREIFFAIISTTLALVAVFLPIVFLGGLTGQLFTEFGMTLAGAVVISSFVALTLAPMLCSKLLKRRQTKPAFYRATEPFFQGLNETYQWTLEGFLQRRWLAWIVVPACMVAGFLIFEALPQELAPTEDRGGMQISISGPEGATFTYMDRHMDRITRMILEEVPEYRSVTSVTSPGFGAASSVNSGFVRLALVEARERERSQGEIARDVAERLREVRGVSAFVSQDQSIRTGGAGGRGLPVQFVLQAPNLDALRDVIPEFLAAARQRPELDVVDVNLTFDNPELQVRIDRDRARDLGVSTEDVGQALQLALSEQRTGFFVMNGQQYDVITEIEREQRRDPTDLLSLYVRGANGRPIQLDNLITLAETAAPPQLYRFGRFASATVSAGLADGYVMGDGIRAMREVAGEVLDERFSTALAGPSRDFEEGSEGIAFLFVFALVLVFLILAAQFESFRDPLIIMFTVPLALVGALFALWLFGQTLNIFSQIGMIMLIGLVTKNGILIVEFANQQKAAGLGVHAAIREGAAARFRPVLMTSISTTLGILPLALAFGAGAGSRVPMGIAVIGGLAIGTVLTLFVIPAVYSYLSSPAAGASGSLPGEAVGEMAA